MNVNEYFLDVNDRRPRWLDCDTGAISAVATSDGDLFEVAALSPWKDERGRAQAVGRWSSRTRNGPMSMSQDFGLARYSFPDGEVLDHISTEIVPSGIPCFFPGTQARILFVAGDGQLYHFAFEGDPRLAVEGKIPPGDAEPIPVGWGCKAPGEGGVYIGDISWPDDPRLGRCVLASLRLIEKTPDGHRNFTHTQLWWLKLNHAGTQIVDLGRITRPAPGEPTDADERAPVVTSLPDGRLALAYLRFSEENEGWELMTSTLETDPSTRNPRIEPGSTAVVARRCQPSHPAFSTDGRWLCAIQGLAFTEGRPLRLPTAGAFPSPPRARSLASR